MSTQEGRNQPQQQQGILASAGYESSISGKHVNAIKRSDGEEYEIQTCKLSL